MRPLRQPYCSATVPGCCSCFRASSCCSCCSNFGLPHTESGCSALSCLVALAKTALCNSEFVEAMCLLDSRSEVSFDTSLHTSFIKESGRLRSSTTCSLEECAPTALFKTFAMVDLMGSFVSTRSILVKTLGFFVCKLFVVASVLFGTFVCVFSVSCVGDSFLVMFCV